MSKPTWITLAGGSGTGDGSFSMTAPAYTGRLKRSSVSQTDYPDCCGGLVTATTTNSKAKTVTVDQKAYGGALTLTTTTITASSAEAGSGSMTGTSNYETLTFQLYDNATKAWVSSGNATLRFNDDATNPQTTYQGESAPTAAVPGGFTVTTSYPSKQVYDIGNSASITNDPGSVAIYNYSADISWGANSALAIAKTEYRVKYGDGSVVKSGVLSIPAGTGFIKIYNESTHATELTYYTFAAAGATKTAYVDTNDSWTVS